MAPKFSPGSKAYDRDGREYVVEVSDGGTVYCTSSNGVETEFPESALLSSAEWDVRADGRRDVSYSRLKQARAFTTPSEKIDRAGAEQLLTKIDRLSPSLLDFAAFTTAKQILMDNKDDDLIAGLSIIKSRAIFDEAKPEVRASLIAGLLSNRADNMISAVKLGDNLLRAMLDKGLLAHEAAFEDFQDRPRR